MEMDRLGRLPSDAPAAGHGFTEIPMETEIRLIHWYDTDHHRIACGVAGQSNSTKHVRSVTCDACRTLVAEARAPTLVEPDAVGYVH
jgi:hypothetical protein